MSKRVNKSGPVRYLSQADIARDYPLEASAEQLQALRADVDADLASVARIAANQREGNLFAQDFGALAIDVLIERIARSGEALALAGMVQ